MKLLLDRVKEQGEDREIDILELLWNLLYRWKVIVLVAAVGLLIGGCFGMHKYRAAQKQEASVEMTLSPEEEIADITAKTERLAELVSKKYGDFPEALDPLNCDRYILQYNVEVEGANGTTYDTVQANIMTSLAAFIRYGIYMDYMDCSNEKVSEFIVQETGSSGATTLVVEIYGKDREAAKNLADDFDKAITDYCAELAKQYGKFTISQLSCIYRDGSASYVETAQKNLEEKIKTLSATITTDANEITAEAAVLYQAQTEEISVELEKNYGEACRAAFDKKVESVLETLGKEVNGVVFSKKKVVLYALVGLILGAFIPMCCGVLADVLKAKVVSAEAIAEPYGLVALGDLYRGNDRYKKLNAVKYRKHFSVEDEKEQIRVFVDALCQKNQIREVLVVSSVQLTQEEKDLVNSLITVEHTILDNIHRNAKALRALLACPNIIVVEKDGVSNENQVQKMIEKCAEVSCECIGVLCI